MNGRQIYLTLLLILLLAPACAGWKRGCSSQCATSLGADWVVVELTEARGTPYRCWELKGVSVTNETNSDGIYWENEKGNLVHVSGSYDYVQVDGDWDDAFDELNLTKEACRAVRARRYDIQEDRYK